MSRFLYISFLTLALVIGVAGAAPATNAQATPPYDLYHACDTNADCKSNICGESNQCAAAEAAAPATPADTSVKDAANTGQGNQTTAPVIPDETGAIGGVMVALMSIFAWLLGVAAITLDNAVYYTVVTMGDYVSKLSAVGVTWRILRDISNIALIFGFLAIGISTILNSEKLGYGTKMLPSLILAAVFLNFSLFFTEAIIDGGNLFATQFYTQINGGVPARAINPLSPKEIMNEGISQKIMSQLGLQTIYSNALTNNFVFKASNTILIGFMSILLFIVTAFVMFSLAFILIARFIILIFLIILAPIGVAGFAIPQLSGASKTWRDELIKQTITAPVLLLMLYIAIAVITDAQFLGFGSTGDWTGFVEENGKMNLAGFASSILSFLVAMGLLLAVVVYSKKLSAFGAAGAVKLGGMASFGAVSIAGRTVLGGAGNALAGKRMQSWSRTGIGKVLRPIVSVGKGLRSSTFDFRNAPGAGAGLGMFGVNAGKGATLTAKQVHEADYGLKPVKGWLQEGEEERQKAGREMDFKDAQSAIKAIQDKYGTGPLTLAQQAARAAEIEPHEQIITNTLSKMSTKQLEELGGIKKGVEELVRNLSPEQFESMMKSDKFSDIEKENMRTNRYSSLHTAITARDKGAVRQWSAKDLATAMPDILKNPAQAAQLVDLMSEGQFDTVVKNDKLSKGQQQQLRDYSTPGTLLNYLDIANGRPLHAPALVTAGIIPAGMTPAAATAAAVPIMSTMSPKKFAKLRGEILTDPLAIALLTPKHLAALMTDGDLDPPQIHTIAAAVRNPAHPNHAAFMTYLSSTTNPIADTYWV